MLKPTKRPLIMFPYKKALGMDWGESEVESTEVWPGYAGDGWDFIRDIVRDIAASWPIEFIDGWMTPNACRIVLVEAYTDGLMVQGAQGLESRTTEFWRYISRTEGQRPGEFTRKWTRRRNVGDEWMILTENFIKLLKNGIEEEAFRQFNLHVDCLTGVEVYHWGTESSRCERCIPRGTLENAQSSIKLLSQIQSKFSEKHSALDIYKNRAKAHKPKKRRIELD